MLVDVQCSHSAATTVESFRDAVDTANHHPIGLLATDSSGVDQPVADNHDDACSQVGGFVMEQ